MPGRRFGWLAALVALSGCGGGSTHESGSASSVSGSEASASAITVAEATLARGESDVAEAPPGDSPENAARRALDARQADILHCYEGALESTPTAHGGIDLDVTFGADGSVSQASAHAADTALASIEACVADAARGARADLAALRGAHVRRTYRFINPPADLTVSTALVVSAPPRRPRRGAAPSPTPAGGGPAEPASGHGPLVESDITAPLGGHVAEMQACYGELLRTARTAAGPVTLDLEVSASGEVESSSVTDASGVFAPMQTCLQNVLQAVRLRSSVTRTRVHYPLQFQR